MWILGTTIFLLCDFPLRHTSVCPSFCGFYQHGGDNRELTHLELRSNFSVFCNDSVWRTLKNLTHVRFSINIKISRLLDAVKLIESITAAVSINFLHAVKYTQKYHISKVSRFFEIYLKNWSKKWVCCHVQLHVLFGRALLIWPKMNLKWTKMDLK